MAGRRRAGSWGAGQQEEELFKTPFEADGAHVAATQGTVDVLLKEPPVVLQHLRGLLVQRVLGVGFLGRGRGRGLITPTGARAGTGGTGREAEQQLTRNRYWRP